MYRAELAIGTILPIESWVSGERVAEIGSLLKACWWLPPVAVVPRQEEDAHGQYILLDDHHAPVAAYMHRGGALTLPAQVYENMDELRGAPRVRRLVERCGFTTVDAVRKAYEQEWRHELAAENVYHIADLAQPRNQPRQATPGVLRPPAASNLYIRPFVTTPPPPVRWVREK